MVLDARRRDLVEAHPHFDELGEELGVLRRQGLKRDRYRHEVFIESQKFYFSVVVRSAQQHRASFGDCL
jgi:hypothetical protein